MLKNRLKTAQEAILRGGKKRAETIEQKQNNFLELKRILTPPGRAKM